MNSTRTRIATLLLVGIAATYMSVSAFAEPRNASRRAAAQQQRERQSSIEDLEAQLERHRAAEAELLGNVLRLEKEQASLIEQIDAQKKYLEGLKPAQAQPSEPHPTRVPSWVLGGAAVFTCALCVIFLLRTGKPKPVEEAIAPPLPQPPDANTEEDVVTVAAEIEALPIESVPPDPMIEEAESARPFFYPALPDWDPASPALNLQAMKTDAPGDNVRSHDSTMELAEIMLSFGRVNSAAEALASYIENNPKDAFSPWLKLLEVYRASGQRAEFDKIAHKLNKTFNVRTVDWENFDEARNLSHGLEAVPHVLERVQLRWGTRECQAYLQYLLRDTRDETRRGFSLAAFDDILCLNDILEHMFGPYTGPLTPSALDPASLGHEPPTETENDMVFVFSPHGLDPVRIQ